MTDFFCPRGFGETDLSRCLHGAVTRLTCLRCPIPVVLMADRSPGADAVNRALAARLPVLLACSRSPSGENPPLEEPADCCSPSAAVATNRRPRKAPSKGAGHKTFKGSIPRSEALSRALRTALAGSDRVGLAVLLRCYRRVECAPYLADVDHLRRALRACGLPLQHAGNGSFVVQNSDHVRAFIRCYVKEAS